MRSRFLLAAALVAGLFAFDAFAAPAAAQYGRALPSSYYAPVYGGYYSGYATPFYGQSAYTGSPVPYAYSSLNSSTSALYAPPSVLYGTRSRVQSASYGSSSSGYAAPYSSPAPYNSSSYYSPGYATPYYGSGAYYGSYYAPAYSIPYVIR
jgi:hypothetical protein